MQNDILTCSRVPLRSFARRAISGPRFAGL